LTDVATQHAGILRPGGWPGITRSGWERRRPGAPGVRQRPAAALGGDPAITSSGRGERVCWRASFSSSCSTLAAPSPPPGRRWTRSRSICLAGRAVGGDWQLPVLLRM